MPAYKFKFEPGVPLDDAEMTLHLAMVAIEGLHGCAKVRLEGAFRVDEAEHSITVDGNGDVGSNLVRVYTGLLIREFGEDAFHVRPVIPNSPAKQGQPV